MEFLDALLPIIIYILLIVLIILLIIIAVKVIKTMDKVNVIVDNVNDKVESLDNLFYIIDGASSKFSLLTSRFIDFIVGLYDKIFRKKENGKEDENE